MPVGGSMQGGVNVIRETAKPVVINNKLANSLTEDETVDFLQSKIRTIEQGDGEIFILRVAPGYALTLTFEESVSAVIMGDPTLASYSRTGRTVILSAKQRAGDTNFKVLFTGGLLREYHLFVEPNYVTAQSTIKVLTPKKSSPEGTDEGTGGYVNAKGEFDIKSIMDVILNYDALEKERAIDIHRIRRTSVFKESADGRFSYYYIFTFPGNVKAVSFSCRNPSQSGASMDPARMHLQVGELSFRPDYISMERSYLRPGQSTTGALLFNNPAVSLNQPFEITLK